MICSSDCACDICSSFARTVTDIVYRLCNTCNIHDILSGSKCCNDCICFDFDFRVVLCIDSLDSIIGNNVKYYRKLYSLNEHELTQEGLAELANVSTSLIGNLESKKLIQGISLYNLYKISIILNVPIDNFFINR